MLLPARVLLVTSESVRRSLNVGLLSRILYNLLLKQEIAPGTKNPLRLQCVHPEYTSFYDSYRYLTGSNRGVAAQHAIVPYNVDTPVPFISIFHRRWCCSLSSWRIWSQSVLSVNYSGWSRLSRCGRATTAHRRMNVSGIRYLLVVTSALQFCYAGREVPTVPV